MYLVESARIIYINALIIFYQRERPASKDGGLTVTVDGDKYFL